MKAPKPSRRESTPDTRYPDTRYNLNFTRSGIPRLSASSGNAIREAPIREMSREPSKATRKTPTRSKDR
jgi:hypothetical protein